MPCCSRPLGKCAPCGERGDRRDRAATRLRRVRVVTQNTSAGFQPFGFAGGLLDNQTGLTRFGARDYDANTGRWTAKDPLGFGGNYANLYEYVDNDPINMLDPTGLQGIGLTGGGSIGVSVPSPYSPYGVTGTASGGIGIFAGGGVGAYGEGGAFAGGPTGGYGIPGGRMSGEGYFVSGDYVGGGVGMFVTNADYSGQLGGDFETWQLNTPGFSFEYSLVRYDNEAIYMASLSGWVRMPWNSVVRITGTPGSVRLHGISQEVVLNLFMLDWGAPKPILLARLPAVSSKTLQV